MAPETPTGDVLSAGTMQQARTGKAVRGALVCGHVRGGTWSLGLESWHTVTAVVMKRVSDSARLRTALQNSHSLPIEKSRTRRGQCLANRRTRGWGAPS